MAIKKRTIWLAVFVGFIITVVGALTAFFLLRSNNTGTEMTQVEIYYLNNSQNRLEAETRTIKKGETSEMAGAIYSELMTGPRKGTLTRSVPNDVIESINLNFNNVENTVAIQFNKNYNNLNTVEALFCRSALVWSLTELPVVNNVLFFLEQEEIIRTNGKSIGVLNRDNVILNPEIPLDKVNTQRVMLYFSDSQAMGLVAEERYITVNPDKQLEIYIIEELLKGPDSANLLSLMPQETKLISAKTEEAICIVDLSRDFIDKHAGGSTSVRLTIYSIINSLSELSNVKRVQFLIEGQKVQDFKGMIDLTKPLEADKSIILKDSEE